MHKKNAIIIGAGALGLTAAHHLLTHTDIRPIVLERENFIGGRSRTLDFSGNLMELDEHRLFTNDVEFLSLWKNLLPDEDFSERQRVTAIFCRGEVFQCPLDLNWSTISRLGLFSALSIGASFLISTISHRDEKTLADVLRNCFGQKFGDIFFGNCLQKILGRSTAELDASQTKLIGEFAGGEKFFCLNGGTGQLWKNLAAEIKKLGGEVLTGSNVKSFRVNDDNVVKSVTVDSLAGTLTFPADIFFTDMKIDELVDALGEKVFPAELRTVAKNLPYRDRVTIGLLVDKLKISTLAQTVYIADPNVKIARLQIFNNLSTSFVADKNSIWLGADYFCRAGDDELFNMSNDAFIKLATDELATLGLIDSTDVKFGVRVNLPKALLVPENLDELHGAFDKLKNLKRLGND